MASSISSRHYRFGSFELEVDERRLLENGVEVPLRPRAFDLLAALVDRAGHLVTKKDLFDRVWRNVVVEETSLRVQLSALRKVLGPDAIATVLGQGYRFTLPVTQRDAEAQPTSTPRHNLPHQLTSFIGREQEIVELKERVTNNRLVTLTGSGGAGKTRLAFEVAHQLLSEFRDGVWLIELAALLDSRLVPQAAAKVLTLQEQPGRSVADVVSGHLASKQVLLVVDNAEHVLEGCVRLLDEVIRRGSGVAVLVTSRERLGVTGELMYRVPSLTVPRTDEASTPESMSAYEGVRLFVERAKLVRPFELTAENASRVASICARLDGMPLAIELAAARLRSMSVDELSERLDQRFALLTDGSLAALPQHRTLRSTIDWSYDLLTECERAMLRRLSVFAGGWTLASAQQVCAGDGIDAPDVIELLASLIDKSLVVTDEQAGATRYRMLETVRQYAQDRLCERDDEARWRGSHLAHFVALAEECCEGVEGPQQQSWLDRIASEHDNLRAALAGSAQSRPMEGLRLANALLGFWRIRGHLAEGRDWLARLLDAVPLDHPTSERARSLHSAGVLSIRQGDYAAGGRLLQESLALYREIDEPNKVARVLCGLAWLAIEQGRYPEAEALSRESAACARAIGDRRLLFSSLGYLASALHSRGDWAAARELYEQELVVARELGTPWQIGDALNEIGRAERDEGLHDLALKKFTEAIPILHALGHRSGVVESLEGLAGLAAATGAPRRAARLWGAAEALRREMHGTRSVHLSIAFERYATPMRAMLTAEDFDQAWSEGRAMSLDDAVRYALENQAGHAD